MKKIKKDKKKKVAKKSKLNGWTTALCVFAAVAVISGGTVLGVYLTGGFDEKIVYPQSIAIEYDTTLLNNGQLEVAVDEPYDPDVKQTFTLKITTPTEKVTRDDVTLSFDGYDKNHQYNTPDALGYISNTVIRFPKVVTLGQEFEVELLTENLKETEDSTEYVLDENGNLIDWIKGGLSTISAQSEDNLMTPQKLTIAVDVPVYKTETQIINSNGQVATQVVTNETFSVKSKFIPAKSEYMYSDNESTLDESQWRTKKTFFESRNSTAISPVYDSKYTMHFIVGNEDASDVEINGYTYQTAKSQIAFESTLSADLSADDYYIRMLENIASTHVIDVAKGMLDITVASVGNYTVSRHSQTVETKVGTTLRLFMDKFDYYENADYLGVDIYSKNTGALLDGMLENIAIAFISNDADATAGGNAVVSIAGGENEENYVTIDGIKYYKPTLSGSNPRYSFWDISAVKEADVKIKTVLLVKEGEEYIPFENAGQVVNYSVNLKITEHKEEALSWADSSDINVMLDYDSEGRVVPETIDLASLASVPQNNIYQDVIFFACFGTGDKLEYIDTINSVLGETGYDYDKSGVYATENGNFTLFALEGNSITLYNTGEFTLYFATVLTNNGAYELDKDGLYSVVLMCQGNIRVTCEKSLNDESVFAGVLNTDNYQASENGEVSINQGNDKTISVRFSVGKESVPVFEDEYRKGYLTPRIIDSTGNDVTSLFIINSESFTIAGDTGIGTLEYKLAVKSAEQINDINGVYIGSVSLDYSNGSDKNLIWQFPLAAEQSVCVYDPISTSIVVNQEGEYKYGDVLSGATTVSVEQNLQTSGEFKTTIKVMIGSIEETFPSVASFLEAILGTNGSRIIITDQKLKTDTLAGQWTFVVDSGDGSIISISSDGKSFVFKNTNEESLSVSLTIESNDKQVSLKNNDQVINFSIVSEGITHIAYSTSLSPYDSTINENDKTTEIAKAVVKKYGAVGQGVDTDKDIVLADLINFYIADGTQEYTNFSFKFNPQYISESSLSETQIVDLFGDSGMLTLYTADGLLDLSGQDASSIRTILYSTEITKIHINKNFAISPTLQFTISDNSAAVNTSFDLTLLANVSVTSENYPATGETLYASEELTIENKISNNYMGTTDGTFANTLYTDGTLYYVVYEKDRYVLKTVAEGEEIPDHIATFSQGKITFKDFWETESEEYRVYFQPEGANYYALNHGITFKVTRDLLVQSNNAIFYVLGKGNNSPIGDYVSVTRKSDTDVVLSSNELNLKYDFDNYIDYDETSGKVSKRSNDFFFDYNQTSLYSNLTVYLPSGIVLTQIPVQIKLYATDDLYREIAKALTSKTTSDSDTSIAAQTQFVGDVEYMMVDMAKSSSWQLGTLDKYYLRPSHRDYYSTSLTSLYEVNGVSELTISLKRQGQLLAGLGNKQVYMAIKVYEDNESTEVLATVHVPMIISLMGYESVLYSGVEGIEVAGNRKLETALYSPEELYTKGIYNEITAGKLSQILYQYTSGDQVSEGGLYSLSGFIQTINFYSFDTNILTNYPQLIKTLEIGKNSDVSFGNITLNHLSSEEDVYLAFEYTLEKSDLGIKQTLYYLVKVIEDITVENPVYAYNGTSEYVSQAVNTEGNLPLEKLYDEYTLNNGYKRFNVSKNFNPIKVTSADGLSTTILDELKITVNSDTAKIRFIYDGNPIIKSLEKGENTINLGSKDYFNTTLSEQIQVNMMIMEGDVVISYNSEEIFRTLKFKNEISMVKVGDDYTFTTEEEWSNYVSLYFSQDYSILYFRPKTEETIRVTIKHSYIGSDSETDLAVVGGEQEYSLIINGSSTNYTVRFIEGDTRETTTEKVIPLQNKAGVVYEDLTIQLIENDEAGSSESESVVKDILQMQIIPDETIDITKIISADNFDANGSFKGYNKSTGKFTLILNEYIDSDQTIYFALFTEQGYLARLVIELKANAKVTPKLTTISGGTTKAFTDLFEIKLDETTVTSFKKIEASVASGDTAYVTWKNGNLEVADLINNREVTVNFTITFDDGDADDTNDKIFKFSQKFSLEANVTKISSYTSSVKTIANQNHTVELDKLFSNSTNNGSLSASTTVKLSAQSSSPAFNSIFQDETTKEWKIKTNYVSSSVTLSATITVKLYYNYALEGQVEKFDAMQEFTVVYAFVVEPSVQMTANYPVPSTEKLLFEFVEDGATFEGILSNFFNQTAVFGQEKRIVMKNGTTAGTFDTVVDITSVTPTIVVSSLQNAAIEYAYNGESGYFEENSFVASGATVTFHRGSYSTDKGLSDSGNDSIIELTFTYQEVSKVYTIYVLKNSISVKLNMASNYVSSGDYGEEDNKTSVNYETIYIDKTNLSDIFAGQRMVYAEMANEMSSYADEYYLVFKTEGGDEETLEDDTFYASYPLYFSASDQGKNLYFDLGVSMAGKEFVGAYLTSSFENAGIGIGTNNALVTIEEDNDGKETEVALTSALLAEQKNQAYNLFDGGKVTLANRVQLVYGQIDGKDVLVDYTKYSVASFSIDTSKEVGKIDCTAPITSFDRNDGSMEDTHTFAVNYYYSPNIDIAVSQEASSTINYLQLEVNKEYSSMAELFGVHHPTNNKIISATDFATGTTELSFETLEYAYGTNSIPVAEEYLSKLKLTSTGFKVNAGNANAIYLFYAGKENASGNISDYSLLPLGADNDGDFVLCKITYSIKAGNSAFEKVFYVVVKVVPDYVVTFGQSADNATTESDSAISNLNNIMVVSDLYTETDNNVSTTYFSDFTLTGENGYLSIKHKNGSSTNVELSAINFTTTMPIGHRNESTEYNNSGNIADKIFYSGNSNTNWTPDNANKEYDLKEKEAITFTKVKEVIFADQYYMVTGKDAYSYTYRLYFLLQTSDRTPAVDGTISLVENSYFDIGVQYQNLSIDKDSTGLYYINSLPITPSSSDGNVKLINIEGIEAWLFNMDYSQTESEESTDESTTSSDLKVLVKDTAGGYTIAKEAGGEAYSFNTADKKYLNLPKLKYLSIEGIKLYDPDDTSSPLATLNNPTIPTDAMQFATTSEISGFFNGLKPREAYSIAKDEANKNNLWQVPRLENTDIYQGTNTADVTLIITLKFADNKVTEYYDLPVDVNLVREIAIEQTEERVTTDSAEINLDNQFKELTEAGVTGRSFTNDTLEVLVSKNSTAYFDMTLVRPGEKDKTVTVSISNTGRDYARTEYISLSQYFEKNVKSGDTIKITNAENAQFFYINSAVDTGKIGEVESATDENDKVYYTVTVDEISSDYIYVEDANLLSLNNYYNVTKYYIMNCNIGGSTYSYQVARDYVVTGHYYKMNQEFITEIGFTMHNDGSNTIELENWNKYNENAHAFTLRNCSIENGIVTMNQTGDLLPKNYIKYFIDTSDSTLAGMSIGSATIGEDDGTITLGSNFNENQYIKVVIKMAVSGPDRVLASKTGESGAGDATYLTLGTLNLTTIRT